MVQKIVDEIELGGEKNGDETRAQNGHGWLGVEDVGDGPSVAIPATNRD